MASESSEQEAAVLARNLANLLRERADDDRRRWRSVVLREIAAEFEAETRQGKRGAPTA